MPSENCSAKENYHQPGIDPRTERDRPPGSMIFLSAAVFLGMPEGVGGPGAPGKRRISAVGTQSCAAEKTATKKLAGARRTSRLSTARQGVDPGRPKARAGSVFQMARLQPGDRPPEEEKILGVLREDGLNRLYLILECDFR